MKYTESVETIRNTFESIIKEEIPNAIAELTNFNKSIIITDDKLSFRLWIRIVPWEEKGLFIDFSNVWFPEQHRRKGLLTKMFKYLTSCSEVYKIRFTSVGTIEMKNWCNKHNLIKVDDNYNWET